MKDIFLKMMFNTLNNYMNFIMIKHFYQKEWDLEKSKNLFENNNADEKAKGTKKCVRKLKENLNFKIMKTF